MLFWLGAFTVPTGTTRVLTHDHHAHSFSSNVGQFVLTASLRSQVNPENKSEFKEVSPERYVTSETRPVPDTNHLLQGIRRLCSGLNSPALLRLQLLRMIQIVEGRVLFVHGAYPIIYPICSGWPSVWGD